MPPSAISRRTRNRPDTNSPVAKGPRPDPSAGRVTVAGCDVSLSGDVSPSGVLALVGTREFPPGAQYTTEGFTFITFRQSSLVLNDPDGRLTFEAEFSERFCRIGA